MHHNNTSLYGTAPFKLQGCTHVHASAHAQHRHRNSHYVLAFAQKIDDV